MNENKQKTDIDASKQKDYEDNEIRTMKLVTTGIAITGGLAALVGFGNASDIGPESKNYIISMILGYSGTISGITGFAGALYFHTLDKMKNQESLNLKTNEMEHQDEKNHYNNNEEELLLTERLGRDMVLMGDSQYGYGNADYKRLIREIEGYSRGR